MFSYLFSILPLVLRKQCRQYPKYSGYRCAGVYAACHGRGLGDPFTSEPSCILKPAILWQYTSAFKIHAAEFEGLSQVPVRESPGATALIRAQSRRSASRLSLAHAAYGVSGGHVGVVVGSNHHAHRKKIFYSSRTNGSIGYSIRPAVLYLQARRAVVKTVSHNVVIKMPAFKHVCEREVVIAGYQPAAPDVE